MNPIKTPLEMLYDQIGITPQHFAKGGPALTPKQMMAMMIIHGHDLPKMAKGGSIASKALGAAGPAYMAALAYPEAKDTVTSLGKKDYHKAFEHGTSLADFGASAVSLPYWILSSMMGSGDINAGTLDSQDQPGLSTQLSQYLLNLGKNK